mgnify:CR=1 FL=1
MIEPAHPELSIVEQTKLLGINRSTLYYKPAIADDEDEMLKQKILTLYLKHPHYGSRKITAHLRREGLKINRKRVQRLMRELGIRGICPGPNLSKRNFQQGVFPYLLRDIELQYPNQAWAIDITYIRLRRSFVYLVGIIDLYSRYIVDWELSTTLEIGFILEVVQRALRKAKPEIFNSDQGCHFTSPKYIEILQKAEIQISMDGKKRALDNVYIERFWRSVKWECIYFHQFESPKQVRQVVNEYAQFYNWERPHQSLDDQTPAEVYHKTKAVA